MMKYPVHSPGEFCKLEWYLRWRCQRQHRTTHVENLPHLPRSPAVRQFHLPLPKNHRQKRNDLNLRKFPSYKLIIPSNSYTQAGTWTFGERNEGSFHRHSNSIRRDSVTPGNSTIEPRRIEVINVVAPILRIAV